MSDIYSDMDDIETEIMKCLGDEFDLEHLDSVALEQETTRLLGNRDWNDLCRTKRVPLS